MHKLFRPREAARIVGISYSTLKEWIYRGRIRSVKTFGSQHRVPASEIDRLISKEPSHKDVEWLRRHGQKISGRNQLSGRVLEVKYEGLLAQVTVAIGEQHVTAIITADAAKEMRLKSGEVAAALFKSTEVMINAFLSLLQYAAALVQSGATVCLPLVQPSEQGNHSCSRTKQGRSGNRSD